MDAAKGQYINFLPEVLRLMTKGGLLVSDNVLQEGDIIESRLEFSPQAPNNAIARVIKANEFLPIIYLYSTG